MVRLSIAAILTLVALVAATPRPITPDPNGDKNVGNGQGLQFITGGCLSSADCNQNAVQSCCAFIAGGAATGICSGIAVGDQNGKAGCGFGDDGNGGGAAQGGGNRGGAGEQVAAPPAQEAPAVVCGSAAAAGQYKN